MQVVLTTINGGHHITDQPTDGRITGRYADTQYTAALAQSRAESLEAWQHKTTGEVRVLSDGNIVGCAYRDEAGYELFQWLGNAKLITIISHAIVVDEDSLDHYVRAVH